jgi:DNA-binding NarL/FixJ family response regulator
MANKPTGIIIDALTGEIVEQELDANQLDEIAKLGLAYEEQKAEEQAKAAARESALAKLAALGLTEAEIAAL